MIMVIIINNVLIYICKEKWIIDSKFKLNVLTDSKIFTYIFN